MEHGHTMVHESAFWYRGILPHAPTRVNLEDTAPWGHGVTRRIVARESTTGAVHGEENLKDQSRWEDMFTPGRQICSQATMRSYLTPIRLQKPRSPNACRLEWSNKICHMSRVMCEETTPYRVFGGQFGNIWQMWRVAHLCVSVPFQGHTLGNFSHLWWNYAQNYCGTTVPFEESLKPP